MKTISSCRIYNSKDINSFFDLGKHPLANSFPIKVEVNEKFYPLSLSYCKKCSLVQLDQTIEREKLFLNYIWVTGTSQTANIFAYKFYEKLVSRTESSKDDYLLKIASNDGTFLTPFIKNGYNVIGIDSAQNICRDALKKGIPVICDH